MLKVANLRNYLCRLYGREVNILSIGGLTDLKEKDELKGFGYGSPILIEFEMDGQRKRAVLETMKAEGFGHDHFSDRACSLLLAHSTYNKLPKHISSLDVGAFTRTGSLISLGEAVEFFLLDEYIEGKEYFHDLERIKEQETISEEDVMRAQVLSDYLVEIHTLKKDDLQLYTRRIRDLVGHGECIMGLIDSYPRDWHFVAEDFFQKVEVKCIEWRWRIKDKGYRLSQVHGDFHPWNVLFKSGLDFWVLDRSRGEWGEPADDFTAMSINYIFYSLQKYGELKEPFRNLFLKFVQNYLEKTGDEEIFLVCQPFYAWRGLVIASPIWYPNLADDVRKKLFNFIINVLDVEKFDIHNVNSYFEPS
ncbi:MAG: aminoglycoside phosphotransferase family protein [Actinomycetota bacterium]